MKASSDYYGGFCDWYRKLENNFLFYFKNALYNKFTPTFFSLISLLSPRRKEKNHVSVNEWQCRARRKQQKKEARGRKNVWENETIFFSFYFFLPFGSQTLEEAT